MEALRPWPQTSEMKEISVEILSAPASGVGTGEKSWAAVFADLVKARLTTLVLLTTLVGFYVGWRGPMDFALMFNTLAATALVAAGAAALNQLLEREYDAKMRRTQNRPLPSGRLQPTTVMLFGGVCAVMGSGLSRAGGEPAHLRYRRGHAHQLSVYLHAAEARDVAEHAIGAVPGALPPLMGWTAARGELSGEGWALFAILAFWQIPHFMAIAWMYRDEYARAGFKMLPVIDPDGLRTGQQAVSHTLALLLVALCPFAFNMAGPVYLVGRPGLGRRFPVVRDSIFTATYPERGRGNCFSPQSFICRCCWR